MRGRHATHVGAGIFVSRLTGLARDIAVAAFLGTRLTADAYWAAIKIPNIIRNLLGEGTLSASFVPVYSEQLDRFRFRRRTTAPCFLRAWTGPRRRDSTQRSGCAVGSVDHRVSFSVARTKRLGS